MSGLTNRRRSFRLDDTMKIRLRAPSPESLEEILSDFDAFRLRHSLKSNLRNQSELRLPKLLMIRKREPDVADYIEHLESQITQLAQRLTDDTEMELDSVIVETAVNLSSAGIRFRTSVELQLEQLVELGMLLSTSEMQVIVVARVVRLDEVLALDSNDSQQWEVSLEFEHIHEDDVEAVIRHLAKLQQLHLRARREGQALKSTGSDGHGPVQS